MSAQKGLYYILEVSMLSRVNDLRRKGGSEQKCTQAVFKLGQQKHAQTNLDYVVWREISVCISSHCNFSAIISTGRKPGMWARREPQCSQDGPSRNKDPCVCFSHRTSQSVPHTHCVWHQDHLLEMLHVKGSFGLRSNEG